MKPIIPFALVGALLTVGANAATTDPVGYITSNVNGNSVGSPAGATTFVSPTLVEAAAYQGESASAPTGKTVTLPTGVPTDLDGTYYVEITSGDQEGWWSTVTGSTDTSIEIFDDFPAGLDAATSISVRKFVTIGGWLGDNLPGLQEFNGAEVLDRVEVLDPVTQQAVPIVYATTAVGAAEDGWYNANDFQSANDIVVHPGTSIRFVVFGTDNLSFVNTGEVKLTKTQVDIYPRDNWIGQTFAVGQTLGGLELGSQLVGTDGSGTPGFDVIEDVQPDQSTIPYAAVIGAPFDVGNLNDGSDATGVVVPEGQGIRIKRDPGVAASVVTFPAQTVAP